MSKLNTYEAFRAHQREQLDALTKLSNIGVSVDSWGALTFNWQKAKYINEAVSALNYFDQLELAEKVALAMAVCQEEINGYLSESEYEFASKFFNLIITKQMARDIGERFI